MLARPSPRHAAGLAAVVAVLVCLPSLSGGFVIDDAYLVVNNQGIRSLGNALRFFSAPWGGGEGASGYVSNNAGYYRPLTTLLFAVEYAAFGLRPLYWHLVSVLLHAGAAALAALLAWRLLRSVESATVAGLLFALHPVHTEAIAAICYQTTLLAAVLAMGALSALAAALDARLRLLPATAICAALAALATLAKEDGATVVLLALAYVVVVPGDAGQRAKRALLVAMSVAVAVVLLARAAVLPGSTDSFFGPAPFAVKAMTMLGVVALYARLLVAPLVLCPFYDWFIVPPSSRLSGESAVGVMLVIGVTVAMVRLRKQSPSAALGLAWLALALAPVMQLVPLLNVAAERFLYLPSLGFAIAAATAFAWAKSRRPKVSLAIAAVLLSLFAGRTLSRWPDWKNDRALNLATAADFPESPTPLLNLAQLEVAAGNPTAALEYLKQASDRAPGWDVPPRRAAEIRAGMRP